MILPTQLDATRLRPIGRPRAGFVTWSAAVLGLVTLLAPLAARAEECPTDVPAASRDRRALAKDWFSRAEAADAASDPIGAVRAYQCSLKMVPHAFTAFNLARLAERTGDLELAVDAYGTYIKLAPEAPDRAEIEAKIVTMNERIQALRKEQELAAAPIPANPTPAPPIEVKPPTPAPGLIVSPPPKRSEEGTGPRILPWVVGGVGVAALATGIVLNIGARGKMTDCFALAKDDAQRDAALKACDAAKPRAYASYALFGVAGAAAVADAVLIFMTRPDGEERKLAAVPLADGAAFIGRFKF